MAKGPLLEHEKAWLRAVVNGSSPARVARAFEIHWATLWRLRQRPEAQAYLEQQTALAEAEARRISALLPLLNAGILDPTALIPSRNR